MGFNKALIRTGLALCLAGAVQGKAHGSTDAPGSEPEAPTTPLAAPAVDPSPTAAPIATPPRLQINGFGTLGLAHADLPRGWGLRRDLSESGEPARRTSARIDSRLGLQLNFQASERVELVAQAVIRSRNDRSTLAALEWGFVGFSPTPDWTLRVGRFNPNAFLLSSHRNVGFAYPWVRPDISFYGAIPLYSVTGADVGRNWIDGDAYWRLRAFAGGGRLALTPRDDDEVVGLHLQPAIGASVSRERGGLLLKASLVRLKVSLRDTAELARLDQALAQIGRLPIPEVRAQVDDYRHSLGLDSASLSFLQLGARYDGGTWLWSTEFAHLFGRYPAGHSLIGYFSLGRRIGPVTAFGVIGASHSRNRVVAAPQWSTRLAPILGSAMAAEAQQVGEAAAFAANAHRQQQRSLSLGLRWDLAPQVALKFQWDRFLVESQGSRAFRNGMNQGGQVDVASLALDFLF